MSQWEEVDRHIKCIREIPPTVVVLVQDQDIHVVILSLELISGHRPRISIWDASKFRVTDDNRPQINEWFESVKTRWNKLQRKVADGKVSPANIFKPVKSAVIIQETVDDNFYSSRSCGEIKLLLTDYLVEHMIALSLKPADKVEEWREELVQTYSLSKSNDLLHGISVCKTELMSSVMFLAGESKKISQLRSLRVERRQKKGESTPRWGIDGLNDKFEGVTKYITECVLYFLVVMSGEKDRLLISPDNWVDCGKFGCASRRPHLLMKVLVGTSAQNRTTLTAEDDCVICCRPHKTSDTQEAYNQALGLEGEDRVELALWDPRGSEEDRKGSGERQALPRKASGRRKAQSETEGGSEDKATNEDTS